MTIAQRLNPLDPINTENLGKLWQQWAFSYPDDPQWVARLDRAEAHFAKAFAMSPNGLELRDNWASFEQLAADAKFEHGDYLGGLIALGRWRSVDPASADDSALGFVIDQSVAVPAEGSEESAERRAAFVGALNQYEAGSAASRQDDLASVKVVVDAARAVLDTWDAN